MKRSALIIIPAFNEVENISLLNQELLPVAIHLNARLLIVDNGSTDGTRQAVQSASCFDYLYTDVRCKTGAIKAAIEISDEPLIATIDADLQEDPQALIPMMGLLNKCDFVQAVRVNRADSRFLKAAPSRLYNQLVRLMFETDFQDVNCGLRAFRREIVEHLQWFPGAHRLFPVMVQNAGKNIQFYSIRHRTRRFGKPKYSSPARFFSSIRDLYLVYRTLKS